MLISLANVRAKSRVKLSHGRYELDYQNAKKFQLVEFSYEIEQLKLQRDLLQQTNYATGNMNYHTTTMQVQYQYYLWSQYIQMNKAFD